MRIIRDSNPDLLIRRHGPMAFARYLISLVLRIRIGGDKTVGGAGTIQDSAFVDTKEALFKDVGTAGRATGRGETNRYPSRPSSHCQSSPALSDAQSCQPRIASPRTSEHPITAGECSGHS